VLPALASEQSLPALPALKFASLPPGLSQHKSEGKPTAWRPADAPIKRREIGAIGDGIGDGIGDSIGGSIGDSISALRSGEPGSLAHS